MKESTRRVMRALSQMSTGSRLASGQADSVLLSSVNRMQSQIRGLGVEVQGLNQAKSLAATGQAAIQAQLSLVQRMRELAVQAGNGVLSSEERMALQSELSSLLSESQRVALETEWGGIGLLNGSRDSLEAYGKTLELSSTTNAKLFQKTVGASSFNEVYSTSTSTSTVRTGDFNGDGKEDFISGLTSGVFEVHLGRGDGTFRVSQTISKLTTMNSFELGDINGDGIDDLIARSGSLNTLEYHLGRGDGSFSAGASWSVSYTFPDIAVADYDGDGKKDVFAFSGGSFSIFAFENGQFEVASSGALSGASTLRIADQDFNGDGLVDIITTEPGTAYIGVHFNNGQGGFNRSVISSSINYQVQAADFNGDGHMDLLGLNNFGTFGLAFLNDGAGNFTQTDLISGPASWSTRATFLDFNGDDTLDILVGGADGVLSVFLGEGGGVFANRVTINIPSLSGSYRTMDVNGDGVLDMIGHSNAGIRVLEMNTRLRTDLSGFNLLTEEAATNSLLMIDGAISKLTEQAHEFSLFENQLDQKMSSQQRLSEVLGASLATLDEPDYAELTAKLVQEQIREQAQVAVLAQANAQMQIILNLLR